VSPRAVAYAADGWGVGELWLDGSRLVWHELPTAGRSGTSAADAHVGPFEAYFAGERVSFDDVEVDMEDLTLFGRDVAAALRSVPYGEVVSYADLARLAGHPRAHRAAGTFCARNRFPLVLPCHRVVSSDGIGSFGSLGVDYKRRLLALEGVAL
jgi:methylated-DNA-[protein]-cysteine S-methyltransferase